MRSLITRRRFVRGSLLGGLAVGLGDIGFLSRLPAVSAEEAKLDPNLVQLRPEIEPLVRLLEETPRERLLEEVGARIRHGLAYPELLAALLLAGVRNVEPRPAVGFKFHAVLVIHSAHLASVAATDAHRWLPIFWALDYFKVAQAQNIRERAGWRMRAVRPEALPEPGKARAAFIASMDKWDVEAADAAVTALARRAGPREVFELLWRYGARDFRDIGHKAIFVANSWRALRYLGWQNAEPVVRSLAYALLAHGGENPARADNAADRAGRRNGELAAQIRRGWPRGRADANATDELLRALRSGSDEDASRKVIELLNRSVAPQSLWDALLAGAGELLMRQPNILSLHAVTSTNALRFAFATAEDDALRRWLLLQNAAFLVLFRNQMEAGKDKLADRKLDQLEPLAPRQAGAAVVEEILADVSRDRAGAAGKTLAYLQSGGDAKALMNAARLVIFFKGTDAHDYKFSSAVLEDYARVSPAWRDRFLAAGMFQLRGSQEPENSLVARTRAALAGN